MKIFPKAAHDPRKELQGYRHFHPERVNVYVNTIALRELVAGGEKRVLFTLGISTPGDFTWQNSVAPLIAMGRSNVFDPTTGQMGLSMLAGLKTALHVAENSAEFKAAVAEYEPLLKRAADLEAEEEKARLDRQRAEADLLQTREAARKRALENVESDPEVVALREKLSVSNRP